jgi:predicted PurR-regulated permease PerM
MQTQSLTRTIQILFLFFLIVCGLYFAKPFLVPFAIAGLLSMLLVPMSRKLESKGLNRAVAALVCILVFLLLIAGIITLLGWQLSGLSSDLPQAEEKITKSIGQLRQSISSTLGISPQKQQEILKQQQSSGGSGGGMGSVVSGIMASIMSFLVDFIIVMVYLFLLLFFRGHIKKFIFKLVPREKQGNAQTIITNSQKVAFKYVSGMAMMIVLLWIMYGIGFSIAGVKQPIFFAILCGVLEIIPFVGNITGTLATLLMGLTQGGGSGIVIGILVTYFVVQFIQSYIIEPLVVGAEVNINPLFTILALVVGELIWGIPGLVLSIPLLGIAKIICDHVPGLQPYGFLIGEEKKEGKKNSFIEKIKKKFKKGDS